MKTLALKTKFQYIFCLIITLGFCNFKDCRAQSSIEKDTVEIENIKAYYPSMVFGRSFNAGDLKIGINLSYGNETHFYKNQVDSNLFRWGTIPYKQKTLIHSKLFASYTSINHHFIRTPGFRKVKSQSIEYFLYEPNSFIFGLGVQIQHYNFETMSVSPHIKILPPFLNLFIKYNHFLGEKLLFHVPKFEFGIEFNPLIFVHFGKEIILVGQIINESFH